MTHKIQKVLKNANFTVICLIIQEMKGGEIMGNIPLEKAAKIIGEENLQKLIDAFPGGQIYLKRNIIDLQSRNKTIIEDFYSSTLSRIELAQKYDLSESSIDKIIKKAAEEKHNI